MTHAHINGVCIRPEEARDCRSPFKKGDGLRYVQENYSDPEFGFDTTPNQTDSGRTSRVGTTLDDKTAALSAPGPEREPVHLWCNIPGCTACHPSPEKYVDVCSSGPTPEFLAEQKRWYHSGERGFDDRAFDKTTGIMSHTNYNTGDKCDNECYVEVDDIADLDCENEEYWVRKDVDYFTETFSLDITIHLRRK